MKTTEYFVIRKDGIYHVTMPEEKQSHNLGQEETKVSNTQDVQEHLAYDNMNLTFSTVYPLQCNVERKDGKVVVTF